MSASIPSSISRPAARSLKGLSFDFPKHKQHYHFNIVILVDADGEMVSMIRKMIIDHYMINQKTDHPKSPDDCQIHITKLQDQFPEHGGKSVSRAAVVFEAAFAAYKNGWDHLIVIEHTFVRRLSEPFHLGSDSRRPILFLKLKTTWNCTNFAYQNASLTAIFSMVVDRQIRMVRGIDGFTVLPDFNRPLFSDAGPVSESSLWFEVARELCSKKRLPLELVLMVQDKLEESDLPKACYQPFNPKSSADPSIHIHVLIPLTSIEISSFTNLLNTIDCGISRQLGLEDKRNEFRVHPWKLPYPATRRHVCQIFKETLSCSKFEKVEILFLHRKYSEDSFELAIGHKTLDKCLRVRSMSTLEVVDLIRKTRSFESKSYFSDLLTEVVIDPQDDLISLRWVSG